MPPTVTAAEPVTSAAPGALPGVVLVLLGSFLAVHLLRWALPTEDGAWLTEALAFIPAREAGLATDLPGGRIAIATSFVTHQFVHGEADGPCKFLIVQGVGVYDFVAVGG